MLKALSPVSALLVGVAILLTGQGLQGTLVPVRAGLEAFSTFSIGLIGAAYFLGFTLGCLYSGKLLRRVGHVRVFAAMTATASAVPLLHGLLAEAWVWGALRGITGFCFAVLYVVIESWINERASNENRGVIFSSYVVITLTVMAAGQMMLLLYDPMELAVFAIASVLVSMAALPVALSTASAPPQPLEFKLDLKELFRTSPTGTLGCLCAGLANGAFWSLAPIFTASESSNTDLASWFMTGTVIGGALGQWPLGYLSDKIGRRKVLVFATIAGIVAGVVLTSASSSPDFLKVSLLGACWGAAAFPLYSVSVAHANDYAQADDFVNISSGLLLMYGVGAIVGPPLASALMTNMGGGGLFAFATGTHVALLLYVLLRTTQRDSAPAENQIAFTDALAATYTASSVYEEEVQNEDDGHTANDN
ncbi:MAG: MFS transporter [Pseudomonadota bacterium]